MLRAGGRLSQVVEILVIAASLDSMKKLVIELPEKDLELIKAAAHAEGRTVAEFLYEAARDTLVAIVS
jgi:uncharacterized protein (DUF1778 family)